MGIIYENYFLKQASYETKNTMKDKLTVRKYICGFKVITYLLFFFSSITPIQSQELSAEGYGTDSSVARTEALNALAGSIFVQIESETNLSDNSEGNTLFKTNTKINTDLPLIGIEVDCYNSEPPVLCQASMDTTLAKPLYLKEVLQITDEIDTQWKRIVNVDKSLQHELILSVLKSFDEYEKYKTVLNFLQGGKATSPKPNVTRSELETKLRQLEKSVNSLSLAAKLLSKNITQDSLFIQPPMLKNSREVTPFATAVLNQLKLNLPSVRSPVEADFIFSGEYQINKNGINVIYNLTDKQGRTIETSLVELDNSAYANLEIRPRALDFDALLHSGYAVSNDFKAELATNKGQRQLLFQQGEQIQILVKLNKAGYFYIVGYTKNDQKELSYLLELNDAYGDRRFVYYVNADSANKWLSLGEFSVEKPYGVESLQLVSSQNDLVTNLPKAAYDYSSGYHVISQNNKETVSKTRGLIKKNQSKGESSKISEAVLMFTTSQ